MIPLLESHLRSILREWLTLCSAVIGVVHSSAVFSTYTITHTPTALRGSTRYASHAIPIWQARAHPPPIDVGILTLGSPAFLRRIRHPRPQRAMRTPSVVMRHPIPQNHAQVCLGHRD